MSWEVHRLSNYGRTLETTFRWRWLARLYAWEHTSRGWFRYEVVSTDSPKSVAGFERRWEERRNLNLSVTQTSKGMVVHGLSVRGPNLSDASNAGTDRGNAT